MKSLIQIADFFEDEVSGGAEIVDSILCANLEKSWKITRIKSSETKKIHDLLLGKQDHVYLISNFVNLDDDSKFWLQSKKYFIFEHDHKYLANRDPSVFENFKAPQEFIVNKGFYEGAQRVFCQSSIHERVLKENLKLENTINLGCSLWSEQELQVLKKNIANKKVPKACILGSKNKIKGELEARNFCYQNKIEYDTIPPSTYDEFIERLSRYEKLVFFPGVLESFSRLAVEARILGCALVTNEYLGCASEAWFGKLKGEDLFKFVANKKQEILSVVDRELQRATGNITVILNAYRRPYNLEKQIKAIREQSIKPTEIWLWINKHEDNEAFDFSKLDVDKVFHNDYNWKFHGRFAALQLVRTEFVAVFDDDTIPGSRWFENCLDCMKIKEGVYGSAGVILNSNRYLGHERCGWPTMNRAITRVDLVGHAWFFKKKWAGSMWREQPISWENGEDIQFSYLCQKYENINTYCPPHPEEDRELHGSILGNELGIDDKASSTNVNISHELFFSERDLCVQSCLANGWKTVRSI